MVDPSSNPISAREAASLLDAHAQFRRATRVLTEVTEQGHLRWPTWDWGGKDQVTQAVPGQFQRHQRLTNGCLRERQMPR